MAKRSRKVPRDTVNYTLYSMLGEPVYHGITKNLDRRLREHERDGKVFFDVRTSAKRTRSRADREETRAIHQYQEHNIFGMGPKYNIVKTRKARSNNIFGIDFGRGLL